MVTCQHVGVQHHLCLSELRSNLMPFVLFSEMTGKQVTWCQRGRTVMSLIQLLSFFHHWNSRQTFYQVRRESLVQLLNLLLNISSRDITLTQEMKPTIKQDLQNGYSGKDISTFLDLCSFLDPHFKGQYSNKESEVSERVYEEMKLVGTSNDPLSKSADTEEPSLKRGNFSQDFG